MTKPALFRYFKTSPGIIRLAVMLYVRMRRKRSIARSRRRNG